MSRRRRATVPAVMALMVLMLASACSQVAGGAGLVEGGPVAYVTASDDGGDAALLEGTVAVTDTCLLIKDELGQSWLPVFQRARTTWDGRALTYNGTSYTDGSHIQLGGGGSDDARSADYAPEACTFDYAFYVAP